MARPLCGTACRSWRYERERGTLGKHPAADADPNTDPGSCSGHSLAETACRTDRDSVSCFLRDSGSLSHTDAFAYFETRNYGDAEPLSDTKTFSYSKSISGPEAFP
jgi:hypothetical protein